MKNLIFVFILVFGFTSCNSDDEQDSIEETQIDYSELIGKWNWMFTCGGITGACGYASEDNIQTIEFTDDLTLIKTQNGTLKFYN
jgi:hypothetical protein